MSTTHATHKDQATQVAVRALILGFLTASECPMVMVSLDLSMHRSIRLVKDAISYMKEPTIRSLPKHLLSLGCFVINIPITIGGD